MSEQPAQTESNDNLRTPQVPAPPAATSLSSAERQARLAAWWQLPRRVVLLLIAFGLTQALVTALRGLVYVRGTGLNWSLSIVTRRPVVDLIVERLPNTLILLGAALLLALITAIGTAIVAVLIHKLEEKTGLLGSILKGLGRLWVFSQAAMPVFVLGMLLIIVFAVQIKLLPVGGMYDPRSPGRLGDLLEHLILPALALALFPAVLTAQAVAREVTLPREKAGFRLWLTGLFKALGTLGGQMGGALSGLVAVEIVFAWPGIGRMLYTSASGRDYPVLIGILGALAILVLVGRLFAELFRWLERLVHMPTLPLVATPWRRKTRIIWVVLALLLLLSPLMLAVAGLAVSQDAALKVDVQGRNQPRSANHPWGTDTLGRDVQARTLRGGLTTLGMATLVAVIVLLPSLLGGALTGLLASRRVLWAESAADLLLLPADALSLIPALPAAIVVSTMLAVGSRSGLEWTTISLIVAVALLPRAVRVYQTLWMSAPQQRKGLSLGLAGTGTLILGSLFAGFWFVTMLDFLGLGIRPPNPMLGGMMMDGVRMLTVRPETMLAPGIALWVCAFAFYTAADALVGFFHSKEVLVRMNE